MRTPTRSRARSLTLGAASAALALALVGCGSDDGDEDAASSTSGSASPSQDPSSEPSEEATETPEPTDEPAGSGDVELLDAGSGDMQVLQLDLQEGQTETTTLTFATQTQGAAGAIPPITATTTTEVTGVDDDGFSVGLIPTTLQETTLGSREVGSTVNLEVDVVAKYVERLLGTRGAAPDGAPGVASTTGSGSGQ